MLNKESNMAVLISENLLSKVEMTGEELIIDLACFLYEKKRLSQGKARELTGLNFLEFQKELGKRGIDSHYDEKDLEIDLRNLNISL